MDRLLRFSDYDVFAYLAAGFAALATWDLLCGTSYVVGAEWSVSAAILAVVAAYIIGQILAAPAAWLIERQIVGRVLGRPSDVLMAPSPPSSGLRGVTALFFPGYFKPLEVTVAAKLREEMQHRNLDNGEALFWQAYPNAKDVGAACTRLETFIKLYGFCRNISFVALVAFMSFALLATVRWYSDGWSQEVAQYAWWSLVAIIVALGMFYRYLKFHRLFGVEVLTTFAQSLRKA